MANAEILSAVLNKWAQPLMEAVIEGNINSIPLIANIETKIRSTGWVSSSWNIAKEISPFAGCITQSVIQPIVTKALSGIDDACIPTLAHSIVDQAIQNGSFSIMEGKITFGPDDLARLKRLLEMNLPVPETTIYKVKEDEK